MHKRIEVINSSFLSRDFSIDQDDKIMVFYMKTNFINAQQVYDIII